MCIFLHSAIYTIQIVHVQIVYIQTIQIALCAIHIALFGVLSSRLIVLRVVHIVCTIHAIHVVHTICAFHVVHIVCTLHCLEGGFAYKVPSSL